MRIQVDLRRFDRLLTEPQRSCGAVTPPCSSAIAVLYLSTCGDIRLDANDGHLSLTTRRYLTHAPADHRRLGAHMDYKMMWPGQSGELLTLSSIR